MEHDDILLAIEAERLGVADLLDGLSATDWATRSLCEAWTIRDVVAHLTLTTRLSALSAVVGVLRARGDINRMIDDSARRRAREFEPIELVEQLRETAGSPRRPLGTQPTDPLIDIVVHGQDIARPLGRERAMPVERVVPALEHVWASSFYGAAKRFDGLRFVASDASWSAGNGDEEVTGPAGELLLVSTGRPAGLGALSGSGAVDAGARLTTR
jgi:uncharacterized protein (TIGR03083 family)